MFVCLSFILELSLQTLPFKYLVIKYLTDINFDLLVYLDEISWEFILFHDKCGLTLSFIYCV